MEANGSDQSLRATFDRAKQRLAMVDLGLDTSAPDYAEAVARALSDLEDAVLMVDRTSIFSSNETVEDAATADIRYMAVECLLAQLLLKTHRLDRRATLRRALSLYDKFLTRLRDYDLLSPSEVKLQERFSEDPENFTLGSLGNPAQRRERKVASYKEEQALKAQVKLLSERQSLPQADDETCRKFFLAEIKMFAHQSFPALDLVSQELTVLSQISAMPKSEELRRDERSKSEPDRDEYSERLDRPLRTITQGRGGPLLDGKGRPLKPFTVTDRRTQLRQGVFRPSHNLPTMTIEDYLEEEKRRNGILQGGNNEQQEIIDEDDMDKADEETMKARAWDEFTESNPKGAGNTLNRG